MYCKCNNDYNYQVIGLCSDINKYNTNKKESWTQIMIPEILNIPDCYPDIENLERIYINVNIENTKVINTPVLLGFGDKPVSNKEGTLLSGRKLVVDGVICQTVVYTADVCEQSLHSINFKFPFCTYIIVPDDGRDIELEKYCIDVCVENVFAKVINKRVIFKSVALFLKANKADNSCCTEDKKTAAVKAVVDYSSGANYNAIPVIVKLYKDGTLIKKDITAVTKAGSAKHEFTKLCPATYSVVFEIDDSYKIKQSVNPSSVTVSENEKGTITDTITDIDSLNG